MTGPALVFGACVLVYFAWRVVTVNRQMNRRAAQWDGNHLV